MYVILDVQSILRHANNFFATAAPIGYIIVGTAIGGFVLYTLLSLVRRQT